MLLLFIRHGETYKNVDSKDERGSLTPRGKRQVARLAKRLSTYKPRLIITSGMERAIHTAEEIRRHHPRVKLIKDPDFNEISGAIAGNPFTKHPASRKKEDKKRADRAFTKLDKLNQECVILAIHGNLIRYLLTKLLEIPAKKAYLFRTDNASVTAVSVENGRSLLLLLNGRKHLPKKFVADHAHYLE